MPKQDRFPKIRRYRPVNARVPKRLIDGIITNLRLENKKLDLKLAIQTELCEATNTYLEACKEDIEKVSSYNRMLVTQLTELTDINQRSLELGTFYTRKHEELLQTKSRLEQSRSQLTTENEGLKKINRELQETSSDKKVEDLQKTKKAQRKTIRRLKKAMEKKSGSQPWKECEICREEYSERAEKVPRVLSCGHTLCTQCAERVFENQTIKCPYDREVLFCHDVMSLPKNLLVLHM